VKLLPFHAHLFGGQQWDDQDVPEMSEVLRARLKVARWLAVVIFAVMFIFWSVDTALVPMVILGSWTLLWNVVSAFRDGLRAPAP